MGVFSTDGSVETDSVGRSSIGGASYKFGVKPGRSEA